jgi:hypothetical protein
VCSRSNFVAGRAKVLLLPTLRSWNGLRSDSSGVHTLSDSASTTASQLRYISLPIRILLLWQTGVLRCRAPLLYPKLSSRRLLL